MALFGLIKRKPTYRSEKSHVLTDEDYQTGIEVRRARAQVKIMRENIELERAKLELEKVKQDLEDMRADFIDEIPRDQGTTTDVLMQQALQMLFLKHQMGQAPSNTTSFANNTQNDQKQEEKGLYLTQEQIAQAWRELPKPARKLLKTLDSEQIKPILATHLGKLSRETEQDIINYIESQ
jgi:hypothetical protein